MRRLRLGIGFEPFLQAAVGADLVRREPGALFGQFAAQVGVHAEDLGGARGVAEQLAEQLHVDGRAEADVGHLAVGQAEAVLRRVRRAGDQPAVFRFLDQVVEVEQRRLFQDRVGPAQELAVAREGVMLPEMLAQPGRAADGRAPARVFARRGESPRVGDDVRHPAARIVVGLRGLAARLDQRGDELVQRLMEFGEVADLGGPVVHLHVDVEMPVAVPRSLDFLGPDALQVGGQAAGPRGADEQVAAEVEVQRRQRRVGRALGETGQTLGGRQRAVGGRRQVQFARG